MIIVVVVVIYDVIIVIIIQGDMERLQLNITPMGMMDRDRKDELPEMQVLILFISLPRTPPRDPIYPFKAGTVVGATSI